MVGGRYALEREVGRGGMGTVWLGRDEILGRAVAVKRVGLVPGADRPALRRAEREARLAARLNHPHVVAVFDLVDEDGQQWLVMEYVDGTTLSELIRRHGALSPDRAAAILGQVADALAAAHEAGIVHRDVKPSNILVTDDGQVKLSDFGIARAQADASLTQTGLVTGSPAYLAPEVASGRTATEASDVWSLGATLFHALAGRPPYEVGDNLLGTLYRIVHEEPPRLDDGGWLSPLLLATMTPDPADRWPMHRVRDYLLAGPPATAAMPATSVISADPGPTTRTQVLSAVPPAATPTRANGATGPTHREPAGRRRTPLGAVLAAVALLAAAGLGVGLWLSNDDVPATGERGAAAANHPRSTSASSSKTTAAAQPAPTAAGMQRFVEDYLATVTSDPRAAWQRLTPAFQAESGGFGGYEGFWSTIASARLVAFSADPAALQVHYTVAYQRTDGSDVTDDVTLQLARSAGGFRIAGES